MAVVNLQKKELILTEANFARLLLWLDADVERAAQKYEEIRQKLIKIFINRGCHVAEELADRTIDRVNLKIDELTDNYAGDQRLYFYGVAQNVYREYLRENSRSLTILPIENASESVEIKHKCLDQCLKELPETERDLILEYYREEKRDKIEHRKKLAQNLSNELLRKKTQRIRERLKRCINECLKIENSKF